MRFEPPHEGQREAPELFGDIDEDGVDRLVERPRGKLAVHAGQPCVEREVEGPGILAGVAFRRRRAVEA